MHRFLGFIRALRLQHPLVYPALTAALAVLLMPTPAGADTTYVWKDCSLQQPPTCGSGSLTNPYETIQAAVTAVGGPGAIIAVRPAATAYKEEVSITASGASGNPFTLLARGAVTIDGGETATGWQQSGDIWSKSAVSWNVGQVITNDGLRYSKCSGCNLATLPVGQSFYDAGTSTIYFRCRSGTPCAYAGTTADLCVRSPTTVTGSHVVVDGFTVLRSDDDGIRVGNAPTTPPPASTGVVIKNCTVQYSARDGIDVRNSNNGAIIKNVCAYNTRDGILLGYVNTTGVQGFTVADNVCHSNLNYGNSIYPRGDAKGIQIGQSTTVDGGHTIERNKAYLNQDTGIEVDHSDNNLLRQNQSWFNKDHGFDHLASSGTRHIGDLAYGNDRDGFSLESGALNTSIYNCIMADNGRDPTRRDWELEVYTAAQPTFVSNHNVFYRPSRTGECQPDDRLINWGGGPELTSCEVVCCTDTNKYFATVAAFSTATNRDLQSKQGNPVFTDPNNGDFRLLSNSAAIDAANAGVSGWVATDVRGFVRHDYAGTTNTGTGTPAYADIGPHEFDIPPGAPAIAVCFEQSSIIASWEERGDDGYIGTAGQYQIIVNDIVRASGTPQAPGNWEEVPVSGLSVCTAYKVKVRMTDVDNGQTAESATVSGSTSCGWPPPPCETEGPGRMRAATPRPEEDIPLALNPPAPSVSRGVSTVAWSIPPSHSGAPYDLALYDVSGRRVSTLASGMAEPGRFTQEVSLRSGLGAELKSGIYFLRLRVGGQTFRRAVVLAR